MGHNNKNKMRSQLSGKIINGREVILVEEAEEYIKKMGYIILKPSRKSILKETDLIMKKAIGFSIIALFLFPFISGALYDVDFSLRQNQVIFSLFFLLSGFLIYRGSSLWGGTILLFSGILMALNSINIVISLLIMGVGILFITQEGKT